jgi:hypothetical protein
MDCRMNTKSIETVDRVLKHAHPSHEDFRDVEVLGNNAFDYIRDLLSKEPRSRTIINGLKLLLRLAGQYAQDSAGPRLPDVFDVAASFVADPDLDVRTTAAHIVVGSLHLLKALERGVDSVGGVVRVLEVVRSSLRAGPHAVERRRLEDILARIERPPDGPI